MWATSRASGPSGDSFIAPGLLGRIKINTEAVFKFPAKTDRGGARVKNAIPIPPVMANEKISEASGQHISLVTEFAGAKQRFFIQQAVQCERPIPHCTPRVRFDRLSAVTILQPHRKSFPKKRRSRRIPGSGKQVRKFVPNCFPIIRPSSKDDGVVIRESYAASINMEQPFDVAWTSHQKHGHVSRQFDAKLLRQIHQFPVISLECVPKEQIELLLERRRIMHDDAGA